MLSHTKWPIFISGLKKIFLKNRGPKGSAVSLDYDDSVQTNRSLFKLITLIPFVYYFVGNYLNGRLLLPTWTKFFIFYFECCKYFGQIPSEISWCLWNRASERGVETNRKRTRSFLNRLIPVDDRWGIHLAAPRKLISLLTMYIHKQYDKTKQQL